MMNVSMLDNQRFIYRTSVTRATASKPYAQKKPYAKLASCEETDLIPDLSYSSTADMLLHQCHFESARLAEGGGTRSSFVRVDHA